MVEFTTNTRKERIGNIVILIFVVLVITLPLCYYFFKNKTTYDHSKFEKQIDALNLKQDSSSNTTARHFDENNYQNLQRVGNDWELKKKRQTLSRIIHQKAGILISLKIYQKYGAYMRIRLPGFYLMYG